MCDLTIKDLVDEIVDHFNDGLSEADHRCRDEASDQEDYDRRFKDYLRIGKRLELLGDIQKRKEGTANDFKVQEGRPSTSQVRY